MNQKQIRAAVEAMLFAYAEPIGADKLAQALQLPTASVESALEALHERCQKEDSGLCLLHLNTHWQLATKTEFAECVRRVLDTRRSIPLGPAAMETLTVIAYNQPVSRAFIEQVRGVDSSSSVSGLLEKGLIEEAGRARPCPADRWLSAPRHVFLRCFGLSSLEDLPPVRGTESRGGPMSVLWSVLAGIGTVLLFLLKGVGILLLVVLVLGLLLMFCPFCADVQWAEGIFQVKAGALGITFPVFRYPAPEKPEKKEKKKKASGAQKPQKEAPPRQKAKLTLQIVCTILKGAGKLPGPSSAPCASPGSHVVLGVRGEDPAEAARSYGRLNAWLYPTLGFLDRFVYLDFEQLRLLPDFGSAKPTIKDHVSFRVTARAYAIVFTLLRVLYAFWREKVLDVFI